MAPQVSQIAISKRDTALLQSLLTMILVILESLSFDNDPNFFVNSLNFFVKLF